MGRVCGSFSATCHPAARGRKRRFLATLPCPAGQGALPVCAFDAVCPAGKGAAEWRAGFLACRKRKQAPERFAHQVILPARRGTGLSRVSPPGMELYTVPRAELALSRHSFHIIRAQQRQHQARLPAIAFRGEHPACAPGLPSPQNPGFSPFPPPPYSPAIPQGERRALPAPAQGSRPLRIPFWEAASVFPRPPSPKNAAGGRPLLVGRPPCMRSAAGTETKRSAHAPYSWGMGA